MNVKLRLMLNEARALRTMPTVGGEVILAFQDKVAVVATVLRCQVKCSGDGVIEGGWACVQPTYFPLKTSPHDEANESRGFYNLVLNPVWKKRSILAWLKAVLIQYLLNVPPPPWQWHKKSKDAVIASEPYYMLSMD